LFGVIPCTRLAPALNDRTRTLLLLGTLVGAGCASRSSAPVEVLQSYADALRDGRMRDAWAMLSTTARETLPYERFEATAREHPEAVADAVRAYGELQPEAPVTAHLELASGETLTLIEEGGRWRLDPSALDFYGQHTPVQTLRSYARALERSRWDVMLRLAPERERAAIAQAASAAGATVEAQFQAAFGGANAGRAQSVARALLDALERGRAVEVAGDRATMAYGMGGRALARLVREDGRWRVEEPE
jgi:hypothetical protein